MKREGEVKLPELLLREIPLDSPREALAPLILSLFLPCSLVISWECDCLRFEEVAFSGGLSPETWDQSTSAGGGCFAFAPVLL